jgi:hypothetical protein
MRALLVTSESISEVLLDPEDILESMYGHLNCDLVEGAGYPDHTHAAWADEEGMFKLCDGFQVNNVKWVPGGQFVGKLLVTGFDADTGDTTAATMSVDDLQSMIHTGELRFG